MTPFFSVATFPSTSVLVTFDLADLCASALAAAALAAADVGFVVDALFGHIQDENFPGDGVKNLSKLTDYICLGHIHSRVHKNYLGSLMPSNYTQNGQRYFRTYEKINASVVEREYPLPNFLEFHVIKYGEDVSHFESLTPVFVIQGCPAESLMDSKYKDLHIKKYYRASVREVGVKKKTARKTTDQYFKDFIKQSSITLNRNTVKVCKEALKI